MQTHLQLTKTSLKGPRQPNEKTKIIQGNLHPNSRKHPNKSNALIRVQSPSTMSYNIVNHLHIMQVTFSIMEVMKIPQ